VLALRSGGISVAAPARAQGSALDPAWHGLRRRLGLGNRLQNAHRRDTPTRARTEPATGSEKLPALRPTRRSQQPKGHARLHGHGGEPTTNSKLLESRHPPDCDGRAARSTAGRKRKRSVAPFAITDDEGKHRIEQTSYQLSARVPQWESH
jgi:hypothetical protein